MLWLRSEVDRRSISMPTVATEAIPNPDKRSFRLLDVKNPGIPGERRPADLGSFAVAEKP